MCLIIHKPAGVAIPADVLTSGAKLNPDGIGWMFNPGAGPVARRFVSTKARKYKSRLFSLAAELEPFEAVIHLRMATHGTTGLENCHPFKVTDDLYMVHNGVLSYGDWKGEESDTAEFVRTVLRPLLEPNPMLIYQSAFHRLLSDAIGGQNKLVFMDGAGEVISINRDTGLDYKGVWLSNEYAWQSADWHGLMAGNKRAWWLYPDESVNDFDYSIGAPLTYGLLGNGRLE